MIRTHYFPAKIPKDDADELNRESGRIYTDMLVWHYRFYRHSDHWLSPNAASKWGDYQGSTSLHAHSRDAAQQGFYKACHVARVQRAMGLDIKYPHKRHFYRTTVWKNTGIRVKDGIARLARARGLEPIAISLPGPLRDLPQAAFKEARLVYNQTRKHYDWHFVIEDGVLPNDVPGDKTLAIDLGEIHPMAVANDQGQVLIITARALRSLNQYRNKMQASLDNRLSRCKKGSRMDKRLKRRKAFMLTRNNHQRRDIEHKITRAVTTYAVQQKAGRVVVGDVRDIADGKRLNRNNQQKVSNWSHGKQIQYLTYKLVAEGIALERQDEAYSSKTCSHCGSLNRPAGRNYKCSVCGAIEHRDGNAACNQESKALFGAYGRVQPTRTMYLRPFQRWSSRSSGHLARSLEAP